MAEYQRWYAELGRMIGSRSSLVVLRDDTAACLDAATRARTMAAAVAALRESAPRALLFLDGSQVVSNSDVDTAAFTLASWSAAEVTGVVLNLGGYWPDSYLSAVAKFLRPALERVTGRPDLFTLVDNSRNGALVDPSCNPQGARIGDNGFIGDDPTHVQELWLTTPGTSDGPCGTAPDSVAGEFVPSLATALLQPR